MLLKRVLEPELMDSAEEADAYDAMDHGEVNRLFADDLQAAMVAELGVDRATEPEEPLEFLELGTGTAQIAIELCQRSERYRCLAVDLAPSMLDVARVNLEMAHLTDQVTLDLVDAKALTYDADRFSVVFSNSLIHHLPNPAVAVREAVRVTAPDGQLFFRDLIRPPDDAAVKRLVDRYAGDETEQQQKLLDDSLRAALGLEEMRAIVAECGFDPRGVRTTSDRHWTWVGRKGD